MRAGGIGREFVCLLSARIAQFCRSPRMRPQRAKLKSRRDDRIIAPDKRSAARGNTNKMNISLFSSLVLRAVRKTKLEKREGGVGWALPGAAAPLRCALLRAVIRPPLQGSGVFGARTVTTTIYNCRANKTHALDGGIPYVLPIGCRRPAGSDEQPSPSISQ